MLTIGEFSRLGRVSPRMLRHYDALGLLCPEAVGDYFAGANHTLPTVRAARYTGGVWVGTFLKVCTFQRYQPAAMREIAPLVSRMAHGEGLEAHARAAEIRLELLN